MKKKICGIYEIVNTVNGKRYIGQSTDVKDRWHHHKSELRHGCHGNAHLQYSWMVYGEESFEFRLIEECRRDELQEMEKYYIAKYNSYDGKNGYNATLGGDGTQLIHEVMQFDAFGEHVATYQNGIVASEETGLNVGAIYGCCNKRLKKVDRYIFIYKEEYDSNPSCIDWWLKSNRNSPVEQYDLYGNLVATWDSCAQIVTELGINPMECLLHYTRTYHGFIWKRINDDSIQVTEEYCRKARESLEALKPKKIYQYDADTFELICVYGAIREAIRAGYSRWMLKQCLSGERKQYKGCIWSRTEIKGEREVA